MNENRQDVINWGGFILTAVMLGLLSFALVALVVRVIPTENRDAFMVVVGMIVTKVGTMVDWHYGGTRSATKQTDIIDKQTDTIKAAQAALPAQGGSPDTIVIQPGESKTVTADDSSEAKE